jgi:hypothetical protein
VLAAEAADHLADFAVVIGEVRKLAHERAWRLRARKTGTVTGPQDTRADRSAPGLQRARPACINVARECGTRPTSRRNRERV